MVHKKNPLTSCLSYVSKFDWLNVIKALKQQCNAITIGLIQEHEHFPAEDIMNATRVICSQLWVQPKVEHKILAQFSILKAHYYFGKHIGLKQLYISPLSDEALLVQQSSFFKILMLVNYHATLKPPMNCNLFTKI